MALVYSPGSRQIAEGWSLDLPRINFVTGEGTVNTFDFAKAAFIATVGKHRDRLVAVNDVHTQPTSVTFRASVDYDFIRYEFFKGEEFGLGNWEARTQAGTIYRFGIFLGDGWGLTQVQDRFGNRMDISHETLQVSENPHDLAAYPADFWYTWNINAGLAAHAHLHLEWEVPRTPNATARVSYRNGSRTVEGGALLRSAFTEVFETPAQHAPGRRIRKWEFLYNIDAGGWGPDDRHRYLCEIRETARVRDGSVQSSPPIRFTYGETTRKISSTPQDWGELPLGVFPTSGQSAEFVVISGGGVGVQRNFGVLRTVMLDIDGDGLVDILQGPQAGPCRRDQPSSYIWYRNTGKGFEAGREFLVDNNFLGPDGKPVLPDPSTTRGALVCSLGAVRWYSPIGTGGGGEVDHGDPSVEITRQFIDMNGDGLPDVVEAVEGPADCTERSGFYRWQVRFNHGFDGTNVVFDPAIPMCGPISAREQGDGNQGRGWDVSALVDMNGDRLVDTVDLTRSSSAPWGVWLNSGNFQPPSPAGESDPWVDGFNWNNSTGLLLNEYINFGHTVLSENHVLRDINGDGLPDLIVGGGTPDSKMRVYANTGYGFDVNPYVWDRFPGWVEQEHCENCERNPVFGAKTYDRLLVDLGRRRTA